MKKHKLSPEVLKVTKSNYRKILNFLRKDKDYRFIFKNNLDKENKKYFGKAYKRLLGMINPNNETIFVALDNEDFLTSIFHEIHKHDSECHIDKSAIRVRKYLDSKKFKTIMTLVLDRI